MTTVEPPENTAETELAEERRVHRERREGTLEGATEEQRQRAEELKREANPEKESSEDGNEEDSE